jgi:hypothetical protein
MGRFDALTQLEEPKKPTPQPVAAPPLNDQQPTAEKKQPIEAKKPTKPQNRLSTNQSSTLEESEKPEKYTTHLEPSLIKKVKLHAVEKEIKDYEVVKKALLFYFDKYK